MKCSDLKWLIRFDKWIPSCPIPWTRHRALLPPQPISLLPLAGYCPSVCTQQKAATEPISITQVRVAILELRVNETIPRVLFCAWLPSLSMCLKFMYVAACITRSLLCFLSEWHSIVWTYHKYPRVSSVLSPGFGHLGGTQFGAIMNKNCQEQLCGHTISSF